MSYKFIDQEQDLDAWMDRVSDIKVIGLDTEFLWERTYFPKLCLIQIAAGDSIVCIDTLALGNLSGVNKMMNEIEKWKDAPLWTPKKIKKATKVWFEFMKK